MNIKTLIIALASFACVLLSQADSVKLVNPTNQIVVTIVNNGTKGVTITETGAGVTNVFLPYKQIILQYTNSGYLIDDRTDITTTLQANLANLKRIHTDGYYSKTRIAQTKQIAQTYYNQCVTIETKYIPSRSYLDCKQIKQLCNQLKQKSKDVVDTMNLLSK